MKIDDYLNAVERITGSAPKKSGSEWVGYCPIHESDGQGHKPSLTLREGDKRAVIVNCHAGCDGREILKALGEYAPTRQSTSIVATYRYQDANGIDVREKLRYEPKDFRIRHRDAAGSWVYKAGDGPTVLYRLPEVSAAIAEGRTIFVCEGEKDCDRLAALGLVTTTNIEGAAQPSQRQKWKREYTAQLAGAARVILVPDNDDAGKAHMAHIAAQLAGKVAEVRWLELPRLPAKGDVSDWLNAGHTVEEFKALAKSAPRQAAPQQADTRPEAGADPDDDDDPLWRTDLITRPRDDGGNDILLRLHNLLLILENTPEWRGKLALNEFSNSLLYDGKEWVDAQALELKAWLEKEWITGEVKTGLVHEAVEVIGRRHAVHPVRDYLLSRRWDGIERIPTFFSDFCGAALNSYSEATARCLFVSAVARIMEPGCKADLMIVLEGEQGCGKSRLVLALFGKEWHSEITEAPGSTDFYQALRGRWCCEFGEMAAFGKSDKNRIKQVLSQLQDTYRPSYGRNARTFPRQNIFIGTTNNYNWNDDPTGARRFLPIRCGETIDIESVTATRDQLWAEAVWRFRQGETFHDIPGAAAEQDARFDQDAWEERIEYWLKTKTKVTMLEVMEDCLGLKSDRQGRSEQTRIGHILRRLKWLPKQETTGDRRRFYLPPKLKK